MSNTETQNSQKPKLFFTHSLHKVFYFMQSDDSMLLEHAGVMYLMSVSLHSGNNQYFDKFFSL